MYDDKYHTKVFFNKYSVFLNKGMIQYDLEAYKKRLNDVEKLVKSMGVDFSRNVLIVSSKDIAKEVFLTGFSMTPRLSTFRLYNAAELFNLSFRDFGGEDSEDEDRSDIDINVDVMCLTCNYFEDIRKRQDEICVSSIRRRYDDKRVGKGKPTPVSWVFSLGTMNTLRTNYPNLAKLFDGSIDNPMFVLYDFNSGKIVGDVKTPDSSGNGSSVKTVKKKRKKEDSGLQVDLG